MGLVRQFFQNDDGSAVSLHYLLAGGDTVNNQDVLFCM